MTNTLRSVASVTRKTSTVLLCLGLFTVPLTACSGSSSDGNKGSAGEGSGTAGATGNGDTAGNGDTTGNSDTAGNGDTAGATGSSAGAPGSAGAGSADADALAECDALGAALCHQFYACIPATDLASDPEDFGTSEAECATLFACDPASAACDAGTYSPTQAATCVSTVNALTCAQFTAVVGTESGLPDACATVCQ